jgi:hypothetical protein
MTMSNDQDNEPFLNRWSRQKRAGVGKPVTPPATLPASPTELIASDEPDFDLSKLPNVEDLTADSDVTVFLQKGVPDALKKLALRRMWSLDPSIRDFVEMAENQWDFNAPGGIRGLYQDLPEGTDVSLWLTQATQSVVRTDVDTLHADAPADVPTDVNDENAATQQNALAKFDSENPPPVDPVSVSKISQSPQLDSSTEVRQVADSAKNLNTAEPLFPIGNAPQSPSRSRRHGSALPV